MWEMEESGEESFLPNTRKIKEVLGDDCSSDLGPGRCFLLFDFNYLDVFHYSVSIKSEPEKMRPISL